MPALTSRKLGRSVNQDIAFALTTGGGNEDIINLDGTALTGSGAGSESQVDYAAIIAGTATNAANVAWLDLTDDVGNQRFSQLLVYPLWVYTSAITLSTPPTISLLGEIPTAESTSARLVPSTLHPTLAPVETRSFVPVLSNEDGFAVGLATDIGASNVAGSTKLWRGIPVRFPVFGVRSILCTIHTVGELSNASGKLLIAARGIVTG